MQPLLLAAVVLTVLSGDVSSQSTPYLNGPLILTPQNSTDHNRFLGTVSVLNAILGQLQQINRKMGSGGNSNPLSGAIITDPFGTPPSPANLLTVPLRDCPVPFRKRLLDELNERRTEEGFNPVTYDVALSREAHPLAALQSNVTSSPKYSKDLNKYGQYVVGVVVSPFNAGSGGIPQINLQSWNFLSGWAGVPMKTHWSSGQVEPLSSSEWKRTKAVGLACDAAQLSNSGKYKFWVAAVFKY